MSLDNYSKQECEIIKRINNCCWAGQLPLNDDSVRYHIREIYEGDKVHSLVIRFIGVSDSVFSNNTPHSIEFLDRNKFNLTRAEYTMTIVEVTALLDRVEALNAAIAEGNQLAGLPVNI